MTHAAARQMEHDWYPGQVPANVVVGPDAFLETSYALTMFHSRRDPGLVMERASGAYDQTAFIVGPEGRVDIGAFTCLNSTTLHCQGHIEIGRHCLTAWGAVITDTWIGPTTPLARRRSVLRAAAADPRRGLPAVAEPRPVKLGDNVWIGFDAVIMPGVTLGRGCVVGCKAVITEDVPAYAVVVGNPPRVVRYLDPDDTDEARQAAMQAFIPVSK